VSRGGFEPGFLSKGCVLSTVPSPPPYAPQKQVHSTFVVALNR